MGKALIVIDMLNDFVREQGALPCGRVREIVEPIRARLAEARAADETIIYMCDTRRPDDPEFAQYPPHAVKGSEGGRVIDELAPQPPDYVLPKRRYSAFHSTELLLALLESGARELELTGVCTNICVLYTAADAISWGFAVTVDARRVAALDDRAHEIGLQQMEEVLGVTVKR